MNDVFSKRLKSARQLAGMSMDDLVQAMEGSISKNAISKYEKGQMLPSSDVLIELARALRVKPDFFFRPSGAEIKQVAFRKRRKLGIKEINSIRERVVHSMERYLEIEDILQISSSFNNPLSGRCMQTPEDIEEAALHLLSAWKLGIHAIPNVIALLEDKEIKVVEVDAPDSFDGLSGWANGSVPVVVVNRTFGAERKRFTALHELGHLLLEFWPKLSENEIEKYCHQFAGALLMPRETFLAEVGGPRRRGISMPELIAIKESYGISVQAIMARALSLKVIDEAQFRRFRVHISRNRSEEGLGRFLGKEQSDRFMQLVYRAASEEVISLSKAANLLDLKLAEFRDRLITA